MRVDGIEGRLGKEVRSPVRTECEGVEGVEDFEGDLGTMAEVLLGGRESGRVGGGGEMIDLGQERMERDRVGVRVARWMTNEMRLTIDEDLGVMIRVGR